MDRPIKQKKWSTQRLLTIAGILAIIALIGASYYFTSGNSKLNVNAERISIFEVREGAFQEFIPINGSVLPISSIYLDASVGGRVEEKFVEDGAHLQKGDPIMRLSNTDMELNLIQQETQVLNLLTQAQIAQTSAQQVSINNKNQMADVEQAYKEAERIYHLNERLLAEKAIGSQEFQKSLNEYNYQKERISLTKQILKQDEISTNQKLGQDRETYKRTQNALELMRQKVGDLILRAPVDGQLTSFDAEIG
ncbi:MAG: HlyD family secretion protein, partial [Sphingobacterium sp.]